MTLAVRLPETTVFTLNRPVARDLLLPEQPTLFDIVNPADRAPHQSAAGQVWVEQTRTGEILDGPRAIIAAADEHPLTPLSDKAIWERHLDEVARESVFGGRYVREAVKPIRLIFDALESATRWVREKRIDMEEASRRPGGEGWVLTRTLLEVGRFGLGNLPSTRSVRQKVVTTDEAPDEQEVTAIDHAAGVQSGVDADVEHSGVDADVEQLLADALEQIRATMDPSLAKKLLPSGSTLFSVQADYYLSFGAREVSSEPQAHDSHLIIMKLGDGREIFWVVGKAAAAPSDRGVKETMYEYDGKGTIAEYLAGGKVSTHTGEYGKPETLLEHIRDISGRLVARERLSSQSAASAPATA